MLNQHHIPGQNHTKGAHICHPKWPNYIASHHITLHPLSVPIQWPSYCTSPTEFMHGSKLQVSYADFSLSWIQIKSLQEFSRLSCDL